MMAKPFRRFLFLVFLALASEGHPQRLLVKTTATSANGIPVATTLLLIDARLELALTGTISFPGRVSTSPLEVDPRTAQALILLESSPAKRESSPPESEAALLGTRPLRLIRGGTMKSPREMRFTSAVLSEGERGASQKISLLSAPWDNPAQTNGILTIHDRNFGASLPTKFHAQWELDGRPVRSIAFAAPYQVAVLGYRPLTSDATLFVRDVSRGTTIFGERFLARPENQMGARPVDLALGPEGRYLFALTSGYALDGASGEASSWLYIYDTNRLTPISPPLFLNGAASETERTLFPGPEGSCWVATRSPGTDFAYATLAKMNGDRLEPVVHLPFGRTARPLEIAVDPHSQTVAIGVADRLELWNGRQNAPPPSRFPAPIRALMWDASGLYIGEGGRIHKIDPATLKPLSTLQLQTGLVAEIAALTILLETDDLDQDGLSQAQELALGTSAKNWDSDGDGIPDGADPEPATPSPKLELPTKIVFHGEAVGKEVRSLRLDAPNGKDANWRLEYDREKMPWLRIFPQRGVCPDTVHLGIDPALFSQRPGEIVRGTIRIFLDGTAPGKAAFGSPASVEIQIAPNRNDVRRILWLWDDEIARHSFRSPPDKKKFAVLAGILAGPPYRFTHREHWGSVTESLDPFTVIVLETGAAAHGPLTRHALLNYVASGGALLLLGASAENASDSPLSRWLSPIGVQIATSTAVNGTFSTTSTHELCRNWDNFLLRGGCGIRVENDEAVLVSNPNRAGEAVLAAFHYGLGRIAILAGATPLESNALETTSNRLFAADLFQWLAHARQEINDQDGDGLPDILETRNVGGKVDPSRTDHLRPDTDGDGIPDNMEDLNRNGHVDQGETSPVNPDSDGDGILDGADSFPLPPAGSPHIESVEGPGGVAEGPSEGGAYLTLLGRNFQHDTTVWFGELRSPHVQLLDSNRLIALSPPYEPREGGTVPLRAVNRRDELEGVLPNGFTYTPRSRVRLILESLNMVHTLYDIYEGSMDLRLEGGGAQIGRIAFQVKVSPASAMRALTAVQNPSAQKSGMRLYSIPMKRGELRVGLTPGREARFSGKLVTLRWRASLDETTPALRFELRDAVVAAPSGAPLDLETAAIEVSPAGPGRSTRRQAPP